MIPLENLRNANDFLCELQNLEEDTLVDESRVVKLAVMDGIKIGHAVCRLAPALLFRYSCTNPPICPRRNVPIRPAPPTHSTLPPAVFASTTNTTTPSAESLVATVIASPLTRRKGRNKLRHARGRIISCCGGGGSSSRGS